tara:strand:- start:345 stop:563 length:219 start_codon:yes stop_codon:yes gene_type:complete
MKRGGAAACERMDVCTPPEQQLDALHLPGHCSTVQRALHPIRPQLASAVNPHPTHCEKLREQLTVSRRRRLG